MSIDKKILESFIRDARSEDLVSSHSVEKYAFVSLISGMIIKLLPNKSEKAQKQLASLYRMERFLDRQTYMNVIQSFQSKLILTQDRQIILLEQEKMELIDRIEALEKIDKF